MIKKFILKTFFIFGLFCELIIYLFIIGFDIFKAGSLNNFNVDTDKYLRESHKRLRMFFPLWVSIMFSFIFWFTVINYLFT